MSTILTFPGQGAQHADMLHDLPQDAVVSQTLEEATDTLGLSLSQIDSAEALRATRGVQLSLLIAGVASARLLANVDVQPDMVLGLSIGAYPAAVAAGSLAFADALRLVRLRGDLMQQAYPSGYGMSAVIGLSLKQVEQLVAAQFRADSPIYVANINSPEQVVVAGHEAGLARVAESAVRDYNARKVARIAISVPSHCELLADQAKELGAAFADVEVLRPQCTYISASFARALFQPERIRDDLVGNMARQVHWYDAATHAYERGARMAIEALPGATLTGLYHSIFSADGNALCMSRNSLTNLAILHGRHRQ